MDDKRIVLAIAAQFGISQPEIVASELIQYPGGCAALRIESPKAASGRRRSWFKLYLTNSGWPDGCGDRTPDRLRAGHWEVAESLMQLGSWRVQKDDWFVDVDTPSDIPYADVETIVTTISDGRVVNRIPASPRPMPQLRSEQAKSLGRISRDLGDRALYRLYFHDTEDIAVVRIRGRMVDLVDWSTEIP